MVVNEEKQKMKQQSLFGGIVKHNTKFYHIYKNPDGGFEFVVERFQYHIPKGCTIPPFNIATFSGADTGFQKS